jgi:putative endonuclease
MLNNHLYFIYILTNPTHTTLYIGVTNNLSERLKEHWNNRGKPATFAGRYYCYNLIYYETFQYITQAINRETEIKKWSRTKKENLIKMKNPHYNFLNSSFCRPWPPGENDRQRGT